MDERADGRRRTYGQACPVAHTLDLVGERWTLLIVRDLMFGPLRFTDLRDGLAGIAPNLLSERLRFLVARGIIEQAELPPPAARTVYVLTSRGRQLSPVIHALARFGIADWDDPDEHPPPPRLLRGALLALMTPDELDASSWSATVELSEAAIRVVIAPAAAGVSGLRRLQLSHDVPPTDEPPDVQLRTTLGTLLALRRQSLSKQQAQSQGRLGIMGPRNLTNQLGALFGWVH